MGKTYYGYCKNCINFFDFEESKINKIKNRNKTICPNCNTRTPYIAHQKEEYNIILNKILKWVACTNKKPLYTESNGKQVFCNHVWQTVRINQKSVTCPKCKSNTTFKALEKEFMKKIRTDKVYKTRKTYEYIKANKKKANELYLLTMLYGKI